MCASELPYADVFLLQVKPLQPGMALQLTCLVKNSNMCGVSSFIWHHRNKFQALSTQHLAHSLHSKIGVKYRHSSSELTVHRSGMDQSGVWSCNVLSDYCRDTLASLEVTDPGIEQNINYNIKTY